MTWKASQQDLQKFQSSRLLHSLSTISLRLFRRDLQIKFVLLQVKQHLVVLHIDASRSGNPVLHQKLEELA